MINLSNEIKNVLHNFCREMNVWSIVRGKLLLQLDITYKYFEGESFQRESSMKLNFLQPGKIGSL